MLKPLWRISRTKLIHHQAQDAASRARTRAQRDAQPHFCLHLLPFQIMRGRGWEEKKQTNPHSFHQLAVNITQDAEVGMLLQHGFAGNTLQKTKSAPGGAYVFTQTVCKLSLSLSLVSNIDNQGRARTCVFSPQASQNCRLGLPVLTPHHHTLSVGLVYPVPDLSCELVCHPQRGLGQLSQLMVQEHTARASERKARCHATSATTFCSQLGHRLSRKVQSTTPPHLGFLFIKGTKNVLFRLNDI